MALAGSFAPSLMRREKREQLVVSLGSAALGAAAGWATESLVVQLARRLDGETPARLSIAGIGAAASALQLDRGKWALPGTAARVAGIAALVGWAAPERRRVAGFDPLPIAAAGALALGVQTTRATLRRRGRKPLPYPCNDYLPTTSWHLPGLDFEGQRFCAGATSGLAQDPVRVFVGLRSAANVALRADLAVAELERLGAFERSRLVVCCATLRGYVNPVPIAAEERFSDGDVAHVVVQYFDKRTPWLWRKIPIARQTHRELLARLRDRGGPELCVYGESLGAWASLGEGLLEGVRRGLWVGTPYLSRFGRDVREDERFTVLRTKDVAEADVRTPYVLLERVTDPVVLFPGLELLWRRRGAAWKPGVSFVQGLLDLIKATRWTADQPSPEGHDYRLEVPLAVNAAFGHHRPRAEAEAVAARVLELEAARAAAVRQARQEAARASGPPARRGRRGRR